MPNQNYAKTPEGLTAWLAVRQPGGGNSWKLGKGSLSPMCAEQTIVGHSLLFSPSTSFSEKGSQVVLAGLELLTFCLHLPRVAILWHQAFNYLCLPVSSVHMWVGIDVGCLLQSRSAIFFETDSLFEADRLSCTGWPANRGALLSPSAGFMGVHCVGFSKVSSGGWTGLSVCMGNTFLKEKFIFLAPLLILAFWTQMIYFL